jgi:hypothetical protein
MSAEKVRRYAEVSGWNQNLREAEDGRYIEYADVAGLVESVETLLFELTVCQTEARVDVINKARNELARWQS